MEPISVPFIRPSHAYEPVPVKIIRQNDARATGRRIALLMTTKGQLFPNKTSMAEKFSRMYSCHPLSLVFACLRALVPHAECQSSFFGEITLNLIVSGIGRFPWSSELPPFIFVLRKKMNLNVTINAPITTANVSDISE